MTAYMTWKVAVDIGGTFTDVVALDEVTQEIRAGKTLSTPADLVDGVGAGLRLASLDLPEISTLVHGSTIVINALIERKGARTALVTTRGFRDIYEIGRINRPDAFNLAFEQPRPLIPRQDVFEATERLRADGTVHEPLDDAQARALACRLGAAGYESVAVVFLHSYRNPEHEIRFGQILAEETPGLFVALSHELTREYREYERTSTVSASAFVGPVVSRYLTRLDAELRGRGSAAPLAIMQSNGGLSDSATIRRQPVRMVESGPAGGVVGAIELCRRIGCRDAIAFDMGGTTAKASVIRNLVFPQTAEYFVGGYVRGLPVRVPCLDIVEVGTGGGSIASLDGAGGLRVGPHSAGAYPGPACYGHGGLDATVTDAAVALGVLAPDALLFGGPRLDAAAATRALSEVADGLGMSVENTASGILAIAASSMANAVRAVTTERGLDPRDFALVAYGGNGPLHISLVARELGVTRVVIPPEPAVFSALGMLMADVRRDVVLTSVRDLASTTPADLEAELRALEHGVADQVKKTGLNHQGITFARAADMRYVGQEHSVTVGLPSPADSLDDIKRRFDDAHNERFGHSAPSQPAQIVSLRVSAIGAVERPPFGPLKPRGRGSVPLAPAASRRVTFDAGQGSRACPVYRRAHLCGGDRIDGPAVVEETGTTTLLRPGDRLLADDLGNLHLTIGVSR